MHVSDHDVYLMSTTVVFFKVILTQFLVSDALRKNSKHYESVHFPCATLNNK